MNSILESVKYSEALKTLKITSKSARVDKEKFIRLKYVNHEFLDYETKDFEVLKSKLLQYASTGNTLECLRCLLSSFDHASNSHNELIQKAVEESTGNTSLHLAAMKSPKNIATYTLLLEFGGSNKIKNKLGYTPEDYILGKVKL